MQDTLNQYGYGFQVKVLSSMITDRDFISQSIDLIDLKYFDSKSLRWLVEKTVDYFNEYKLLPTLEVFKVQISNLEENSVFRTEVVKTLKDAWQGIESTDLPFVKSTTIDFCKNQEIKKAILKSVDSLKLGDYDSIRVLINDALKKGLSDKVGHDYTNEIEYRYSDDEVEARRVPTGWKVIDELLGGGMPRGKMGAIMAPTGVGKSWVLSAIGANALKTGSCVLHISLELDEVYVGRRYDAILTGYMMDDMKFHLAELKKTLDRMKNKLIIKYFPSGTLSLNGLESYIEKLKLLGIVPDLVILDYAELMRMSSNKNQRTDEILARLYTDLRGLAGVFDFALWTADQSNRSGTTQDVLEGSSISNAFSKLFALDFLMTLSRKMKDKIGNTARFHVSKNRFGPDGLTFPAKMDTGCGLIEIYHERSESGEKTKKQMIDDNDYEKQYAVKKFNDIMNSQRKEPTDLF